MDLILKTIHQRLIRQKKTIAVAESCTGGMLAGLLTQIPDSSHYFILGIVAYSNRAKQKLLGIPQKIIIKKGAVSKETARLMAKNIRKTAKTDFGLGITGIAGPAGSTADKPLGTVFIACAKKNKIISKRFCFRGSRGRIRKESCFAALQLLTKFLRGRCGKKP